MPLSLGDIAEANVTRGRPHGCDVHHKFAAFRVFCMNTGCCRAKFAKFRAENPNLRGAKPAVASVWKLRAYRLPAYGVRGNR
jgi:hypothetical protein